MHVNIIVPTSDNNSGQKFNAYVSLKINYCQIEKPLAQHSKHKQIHSWPVPSSAVGCVLSVAADFSSCHSTICKAMDKALSVVDIQLNVTNRGLSRDRSLTGCL